MFIKQKVSVLTFFLMTFFLFSCATGPVSENSSRKLTTYFIEMLKNISSEPGLENDLLNAINEEIIRGGNFQAGTIEAAEILISGSIDEFLLIPVSYNQANEVEEYNVNIKLTLNLTRNGKRETQTFGGNSRYYTSLKIDGAFDPVREEALKTNAKSEAENYIARQVLNYLR